MKKGTIIRGALLGATALGVLVAGTVHAANDQAVVKYRQAVMKAHGAHLGAMVQIVKGGAGSPEQYDFHDNTPS